MRPRRIIVAMLMVISILVTMLPTASREEYEASEKVGSDLLKLMNVTYEDLTSGNFEDTGDVYSCIIWISDVEIEKAVEAGIDVAEMTREKHSAWSIYDYPYTTYELDGLTYVDVFFDANETNEYVQTYIETEREVAAEMYVEKNNSFVAENFMARDMSVTYVSRYSPCVFADLSISKVAELIEQDMVVSIGLCGGRMVDLGNSNLLVSRTEIQEAVKLIRGDDATADFNVTGSGVKIGQIEPFCPNISTVNVNTEYNLTSNHATTVYTIMNMVAPDATYYATGVLKENELAISKTRFCEQIEWLLDQGVNIINMSAGFDYVNYLNLYTDFTRWLDHIAYNHDVHFIQASGNNMQNADEYDDPVNRGVVEPGMAYNIITVGNTFLTEEHDYAIHPSSSYYDLGLLTCKPDLVAPGTYSTDYGQVILLP